MKYSDPIIPLRMVGADTELFVNTYIINGFKVVDRQYLLENFKGINITNDCVTFLCPSLPLLTAPAFPIIMLF